MRTRFITSDGMMVVGVFENDCVDEFDNPLNVQNRNIHIAMMALLLGEAVRIKKLIILFILTGFYSGTMRKLEG